MTVSARYRLTLAVEFAAGDDPAARYVVTRNVDALEQISAEVRSLLPAVDASKPASGIMRLKLQRLNDDIGAPPRALVVETL